MQISPLRYAISAFIASSILSGFILSPVSAKEMSAYREPVATQSVPRTATAVSAAFSGYPYELENVQSTKTAPRLYLQDIPADMASVEPVQSKKDLFIQILLPLVLKGNEDVLAQRARLLGLQAKSSPDTAERAWLKSMAELYGGSVDDLPGLIERVDMIPVSLALAQGIDESGWGTSRFARQGESLFGQHAPKDSRRLDAAKAGSVGVAAFSGMLASVQSYFHNLNSAAAYAKLRSARADSRRAGKVPSGVDLLPGLADYSQRGEAYINNLRSVIRVNSLQVYENVSLDNTAGATLILPE